ncbi:MAG: hypothetical protein OEY89_02500, partial [Gammaproteobacteria bacterium]|nr:hypothetical protein [Gammaproteobacteria bacterium]
MLLLSGLLPACGGGGGEDATAEEDAAGIDDFGVAYVKRPLPFDERGALATYDARDPLPYHAGGDLYYRKYPLPSAIERSLTNSITNGTGDVKDVEASYDGSKLVFALRLGDVEGRNADEQPTWNIWEYDISGKVLRRVIGSDIQAEAGQDVAPHYLPDGRIIFSSTRQRRSKAILLDENKPQFTQLNEDRSGPSFSIHVMNADGSDIQQLTFNRSNDLDPAVLSNGQVMFSRWDNSGARDQITLYKMNPDGSNLQLYYGAHSENTGTASATIQFMQPREMADGRIVTLLRPQTGTYQGSDIVAIDVDNYTDNNQPTAINQGRLSGTAQQSLTPDNVRNDTQISAGGRYRAAYPLMDGTQRLLVSWSPCRLADSNNQIMPCTSDRLLNSSLHEADPLYGLYVYDYQNNTQTPIIRPQEGVVYMDVVATYTHTIPSINNWKLKRDYEQALVTEGVGILNIRSVYDLDGHFTSLGSSASVASPADMANVSITTSAQRPARFVRVIKDAAIPEGVRSTTYGRSSAQGMKEIVAYAPVEPDGSVRLKVPADVPLMISVLDSAGRRISARHQNWIQVRPGDVLTCNGCHDHSSGIAHGRTDATNSLISGQTMAERHAAIEPLFVNPSVDLKYEDFWFSIDAGFTYQYSDLTTTAPVSSACRNQWSGSCRIIINYETHIHPLWSVDRRILDVDGTTVLYDNTCTNCHAETFAGVVQVPAGQLDLTDGASPDQPLHYKSYRELFYGDTEQEIVGGAVIERRVRREDADGNPVLDINGNEIFDTFYVAPSMSTTSARASYFSEKMNEQELNAGRRLTTATVDHRGMLSDAELRLISEWLDIGGQYYNNSYDL